ncbi:hypothetical protein [Actinomadura sp. NEAU-AAG7]|uniref:hypothetical protein n=1 Tax=Actinomadura sp. NEAU-AAG7 TaxID=2839640 RepID=UPI001BE4BAFF|nr:hypothetical protein [Actinomadura sp. NEAU-AAG7]MBT2212571.1 hypothetical protein [Actinomadura sp. NEAU-AAG7]
MPITTPPGDLDEATTTWDGAEPGAPAPRVRVVSLRDTDTERLVLTDVDLSRRRFATDLRDTRQVLAEEHHWRAAKPRSQACRARRAAR